MKEDEEVEVKKTIHDDELYDWFDRSESEIVRHIDCNYETTG